MEQVENHIRADRWIREYFPTLTKRQTLEALEGMLVTSPSGRRVKKGERLSKLPSSLKTSALSSHLERLKRGTSGIKIDVLYEDDDIVCIDKPAGIPSHPLSLWDTETVSHWALDRYPEISKEYAEIQPTIVPHRLDRGTTGLLIVAKTQKAFRLWRSRFQEHKVEKKYLAWCWGKPTDQTFEILYPMAHHHSDKRKMVAIKDSEARFLGTPREANTWVTVLKQTEDRFLCEAHSTTGVTHQIRVHLSSVGHPLLGDSLYDDTDSSASEPMLTWPELRAVELKYQNLCLPAPRDRFITKF